MGPAIQAVPSVMATTLPFYLRIMDSKSVEVGNFLDAVNISLKSSLGLDEKYKI